MLREAKDPKLGCGIRKTLFGGIPFPREERHLRSRETYQAMGEERVLGAV